jgi:hypothetical protein
MELWLHGKPRAVSGNGNRVMVENAKKLEIHNIDKDAGTRACKIDIDATFYDYAMNEDGSEAALANCKDGLRVVDVNKVVGDKVDPSAIVTIKIPESLGEIRQLVYSDSSKLHVLHSEGKVSLFDPSTKTLVLVETPEKGQNIIRSAISPNADYIAMVQLVGTKEDGMTAYKAIVKQRFGSAELRSVFGYETEAASSREHPKSPSKEPQ